MGFKQYISRTWQMIEQQVNDVPFRSNDEDIGQIKPVFMRVCGTSIQILQQNCNKFTTYNA